MLGSIKQAFINLFKKPHTINYPTEAISRAEAYRGLIEYNESECIFCDKCEKVCPPGAIRFFQHENGDKEYRYNQWVCIYCGECVRACPKPNEAIWQSEKKPGPAVAADNVNDGWFTWEAKSAASRESYKALKQRQKAESAKEAAKNAEENSDEGEKS